VNERFNLFEGNCLEVMKTMDSDSIDSIVTDPPYELGFMGKSWDSSGIAFNVAVWQEALRVLKPGGHLIAFSGSRTYHRMAVAIEDAGFEIRDQIMWVYGSGFPKSHNISKGIDKAAGAEREVIKTGFAYGISVGQEAQGYRPADYVSKQLSDVAITDEAKQWQGWGTALKPAHEPMVLARKPLIGTVANNVLTFGVGGLNIDGTRVGTDDNLGREVYQTQSWKNTSTAGVGSVNDDWKIGRFPANFIHDGSDEVVALFPDTGKSGVAVNRNRVGIKPNEVYGSWGNLNEDVGFVDSGSAARFFYCAKASKKDRNEGLDGFESRQVFGDEGGTYQGLSNSKHPDRNHHPTVKPTSLMQYLVRLVTPPNGIVLDPFLGSGSTGKAAMYEGFNFVGIELTPEYLPIAKARIEFALKDKEGELDFDPR